jgi:hypothetical protein
MNREKVSTVADWRDVKDTDLDRVWEEVETLLEDGWTMPGSIYAVKTAGQPYVFQAVLIRPMPRTPNGCRGE